MATWMGGEERWGSERNREGDNCTLFCFKLVTFILIIHHNAPLQMSSKFCHIIVIDTCSLVSEAEMEDMGVAWPRVYSQTQNKAQ